MLMSNGVIKLIDFGCAKRLCLHLSFSQSQVLKSMKGLLLSPSQNLPSPYQRLWLTRVLSPTHLYLVGWLNINL